MTDKVQKIREEVQRLQNELIQEKKNGFDSDVDDVCILELQNVLTYIDSLQEEPAPKIFEEALAREWQGYNDRGAATVDALEDNTQELAFAKGFYRGWNYPKSSVWHDANKEQPEIGSAVSVWNPKIMDGEILTMCVEVYQDRIWAYIDDLLKL